MSAVVLTNLRPKAAILAFLEAQGAAAPGGVLVSREGVANAIGCSRSTVGRAIAELRSEGLIETTRTRKPGSGAWGVLAITLVKTGEQ